MKGYGRLRCVVAKHLHPPQAGHSRTAKTTILVVINRLTKISHVIPCSNDLDARQFANLFMEAIVRLHRLPHDIITAKGTLFTSALWKETRRKSGLERRLSTAFHPLINEQTERPNAILE